jgi:RNA recognition motif-containing protein
MSKKLFVGNLDWGATEEQLQSMFAEYGQIEEAVVITDKISGRSKGFGFVTFTNDADADKAIAELDGKELGGRPITVNEARPPKPRE